MIERAANETLSENERIQCFKLLQFVGRDGVSIDACIPETTVKLGGIGRGVRLFPVCLVAYLVSRGALKQEGGRLSLRPEAATLVRRMKAEATVDAYAGQHRSVETRSIEFEGVRHLVSVNLQETPLAPLLRLKGRDGKAFLPEEAVAAATRLASDFQRAGLQPRVTASWEPRLQSRGRGQAGGMADLAASQIEARRQVQAACDAMGPELAGVALDVCCFCKGLEAVERERQWPVRSAKLMLRTALLSLARHYRPPAKPARHDIRHWGMADYRPDL